jgi:two-component system, chemotaxis family, sensor kinase CheA
MDELLGEFLTETNESLDSLDGELVKLEQNPNDPDLLGNIFRLIHTIKGTSGFLGLPRLETVAHHGENVLGNFREGTQLVTPEAVSLILEALDCIKAILAGVEETEKEPDGDDSDLIARLDAFYRAGKKGAQAAPAAEDAVTEPEPAAETANADTATIYERMGGASAVDAAVELLYRKIDKDPEFARFFDGVNMILLQGRQTEFMIKALGGPDEYEGQDLRVAHQKAVQDGLGAEHFEKVAQYLKESLVDLEIESSLIDEVLAVVGTTRNDVLNLDAEAEAEAEEAVPDTIENVVEAVEALVAEAANAPDDASGDTGAPKESAVANQTIRVTVDLLENLMTMVSELVLTRNQLLQMVRKHEDSEFKVPLQRLSHVTTDLQEGVMKTRMQPIGNAWGKLPRIIRDLAIELEKKIDLQMVGADTELDRQVLEIIKDPLTHMVRNSADHGLETPAERLAAGKSETGTVVLKAFHEGGHIIIEISDDGKGINVDKVREKAVSSGVCTEAELETFSEQQILQFIFRAGFSTAEQVTSVSGRGVGMDVVRTNIEKIGGQVELRSTVGKGSIFRIKIPLTLAIVSALIVECRTERYAIPQLSVVELVRISTNSEHRMELINETPVLRLRERLLPLVSMASLLELDSNDFQRLARLGKSHSDKLDAAAATDVETPTDVETLADVETPTDVNVPAEVRAEVPQDGEQSVETAEAHADEAFIVVCQVGTYTFGIVVDGVFDAEEIVVKPVSPILRDISIYSGNTILGDGSVIMILDPNGIAASSGEINVPDEAGDEAATAGEGTDDRTAFLVFRAGSDDPKAVPLALVARLEEIDLADIEKPNGVPVVQYRGQLMPLLSIDGRSELVSEGRQPVLVFTDRDRSMGLLVDEIIDIVEDRLNVELGSEQPGIIGTGVIGGKATSIIDASTFLTSAFDDWFGSSGKSAKNPNDKDDRILLVDDSPFFRNLLTPLLTVAGYHVTTVESADKALALREDGQVFDVIISDIEMPGMTGFEFAAEVRENGSWQAVPMVALSAHTSAEHMEKGRTAGFSDYVGKYDRETLLETVAQSIADMKGVAA